MAQTRDERYRAVLHRLANLNQRQALFDASRALRDVQHRDADSVWADEESERYRKLHGGEGW